MIRRENPNFVASIYAPNPKEVSYWIDLTEGPDGQIIKSFVNNKWVKVNQDKNDEQDVDITQLRQDVNTLATTKANKATTLSGYGITDAYTKTEVDGKINSKANSSDVYTKAQTDIQIETKVAALVSQAPETLDTLDELAAALGDDPNFATTVSNQIGTKANSADVYTKTACDSKIDEKIAAIHAITSTDITSIQVVSELPSVQTNGVLYIKVS